MKNINKWLDSISPILILVALISLAAAGPTQNSNYDLKVSCQGFICSNLNITIAYPNSTTLISNQPMTDNNYYANYSFVPPESGIYLYFYSDGTNSSEGAIHVTTTGNLIDTPQMLLYITMFCILFFFFFLCVYGGLTLPYENIKNVNKEVIKVNWKKYLKVFCWGFSFFFLMAIDWAIWNLTYAYAQWYGISRIFYFIFRLMHAFALPVFIGLILWLVIKYINDNKINEFMKRTGLPYAG